MILQWTPGLSLERVEKMAIQQALQFYGGNKTATSNALGIAVRTLDNKLEMYAQEERKLKVIYEDRQRQDKEHLDRARGIIPAVLDGARRDPAPVVNVVANEAAEDALTPEELGETDAPKRRGRPPLAK